MGDTPTASDGRETPPPLPGSRPPDAEPAAGHVFTPPGEPPADAPPPFWPPPHNPYAQPPYGQPPWPYFAYQQAPRRLHVATILVDLVEWLRSMAILLIIAVVVRVTGGAANFLEFAIAGLGALRIVSGLYRYLTIHYMVQDGTLIIRSGLIHEQVRTIPLSRIQNINLKRELVHRMLGVASVQVETASSAGAEAELSVVALAEAERLRHELTQTTADPASPTPAVETATPVYHASIGRLLLAGATGNRVGAIIGTIFGLFWFFQQGDEPGEVPQIFERLRGRIDLDAVGITLVVAGLLVGGWVFSMVWSVVVFYDFRLDRTAGRLRRRFGLFTRHESYFSVRRLQMVRIVMPPVQRMFGLARVLAETAGSFNERENAGSTMVAPIVRQGEVAAILTQLTDRPFKASTPWTKVSRLAIRRAIIRYSIAMAVVVIVASANFGWQGLWGLLAVPLLAWPVAYLYWRSIGWYVDESQLRIRSGILTRTIRVIPRTKVQAVIVSQNPLQRRLGLARLRVLTAAATLGSEATIPDLELEVARRLQDELAAVLEVDSLIVPADKPHDRTVTAEAGGESGRDESAAPPAT